MKKNTVLLEKLRNSYHNSFIDGEITLTRIINQEYIGRLFAMLRRLLFPAGVSAGGRSGATLLGTDQTDRLCGCSGTDHFRSADELARAASGY